MRSHAATKGRTRAPRAGYAHEDLFLGRFWEVVTALEGKNVPADERDRWPVCTTPGLQNLMSSTYLVDVRLWTIDVQTSPLGFEEFWAGLLQGIGPSGAWVNGLESDRREQLRECLRQRWTDTANHLMARALAFAGTVPTASPS